MDGPAPNPKAGDGATAPIQLYEPRTGKRLAAIDAAPDRGRGGRSLIAASRDDGTVALIDAKSRTLVGQLAGHVVADGGATLWVGAAAKRKPVGLTGYPVRDRSVFRVR